MKIQLKALMYTSILTSATLTMVSCGKSYNTSKSVKTGLDSFSYYQGFQTAKYLREIGVDEIDVSSFMRGFEEGKLKDTPKISESSLQKSQMHFVEKAKGKKIKQLQAEAKKIMDEKGKTPGIQKVGVGALYEVTKKGSGAVPNAKDTVELKFNFIDPSGKPTGERTTKVEVNGIPYESLKEVLQLVSEGTAFKLYFPADLEPRLGGETLTSQYGVFTIEVDLLKIYPPKK